MSKASTYGYAYQFDATLFGPFMREFGLGIGVNRTEALLGAVEGKPLADPRVLRFRAGRRRNSWVKNVIGVGLSSGFLEPLESTSIYLAQMAITYLIELFPLDGRIDKRDRAEFNRLIDMEYDRIRDFLILHYHATARDDSPFWDHVRTMEVPDTLAGKMELWRETVRVEKYSDGLFFDASWLAVYVGQGVLPERHDARVSQPDPLQVARAMEKLKGAVAAEVEAMPGHREYLMAEAAIGRASASWLIRLLSPSCPRFCPTWLGTGGVP